MPVALQIVLNRADFNIETGNTFKISQKFTFPEKLDLGELLGDEAFDLKNNPKQSKKYRLFAMLIHQG